LRNRDDAAGAIEVDLSAADEGRGRRDNHLSDRMRLEN
jgi:hypothetical protein